MVPDVMELVGLEDAVVAQVGARLRKHVAYLVCMGPAQWHRLQCSLRHAIAHDPKECSRWQDLLGTARVGYPTLVNTRICLALEQQW